MNKILVIIICALLLSNINLIDKHIYVKDSIYCISKSENIINKGKYEIAGIKNDKAFEKMVRQLKMLVEKDNKEKVAYYINYPLRVNSKAETIIINNIDEFIKSYDSIITDNVKKALLNQKIDNLFVNYQGVMVGNGQIWFGVDHTSGKVGVIAFNI